MEATVFLVLLLSIYYIKRRSIADATIYVYLPAFLIIPGVYSFRLPHLPALDFGSAALIPIVVALIVGHWREWKLQRTDLWIAIFFFGSFYSELSHSGSSNAGLIFFAGVFGGIFPYILGKMLLEQEGTRERFARQFVFLCFIIGILSAWEFRMGTDLFTAVAAVIFGHNRAWIGQPRNGFMRIAGPFTGAIMAGTMFSIAVLLNMWLGTLDKTRGNEKKYCGMRRSTILSIGTVGGLLMTLSRGPIIGTILGYLIARIGKAKNMRVAAIVTVLVLTISGTIGYIEIQRYTSGDIFAATSKEQENAIYRRQLLDNYKPIVEKGGLFGYGVVEKPTVAGQSSIDNAYLFLQIIQGNLGLWMFLLLGVESLLAVYKAARRSTDRSDILFVLCIGGGMAGFLLALTSVYLGGPMYPLFFMLVGWTQSLRQTQTAGAMLPQPVNPRFSFRRVIA